MAGRAGGVWEGYDGMSGGGECGMRGEGPEERKGMFETMSWRGRCPYKDRPPESACTPRSGASVQTNRLQWHVRCGRK